MAGDWLFEPGQIRTGKGAEALGVDVGNYLARHLSGDWGLVSVKTKAANERAVERGRGVISSAYQTADGWLFVITSANRSATSFLLPKDVEAYLRATPGPSPDRGLAA